jgi:hypothetical protein
MTLLMLINLLLMLLGPALIVGGIAGLATVSGLPRRPRCPMARPARWAVV